jgi:tripartite motif-containing protein 71
MMRRIPCKRILLSFPLTLSLFVLFGCNPLGVSTLDGSFHPGIGNDATSGSTDIIGSFIGAIGKTTASTGTCPVGTASSWCTGGTFTSAATDGTFNNPYGVAVDGIRGFIYIAEFSGHRVQKINSATGSVVGAIGRTTASTGTCPVGTANSWCTGGTFTAASADGEFTFPMDMAVDSTNGFLYVADYGNHRVQKLNLITGAFVGAIGNTIATAGTCPAAGATNAWCTGGTFATGAGDGMFNHPASLDIANGFLYVADYTNQRIQKINLSTGAFVGAIGKTTASTGTCPVGAANAWCTGGTFTNANSDGAFWSPGALAVDIAGGFLYVADSGVHRVQKILLSTGGFVGAIGKTTASTGTCPVGPANGWCTGGTFGGGGADGTFSTPVGLTVDFGNGYLYVADQNNHRLQKISLATGSFVGAIGKTTASTGSCPVGTSTAWCTGGTFALGAADGMFNLPDGVDYDSINGYLFVADYNNNRIEKYR